MNGGWLNLKLRTFNDFKDTFDNEDKLVDSFWSLESQPASYNHKSDGIICIAELE